MKFCKRFLSLLLVFVSLFAVFSIPVNAETLNSSNIKVNILPYIDRGSTDLTLWGQLNLNVGEGSADIRTATVTAVQTQEVLRYRLIFTDTSGVPMFKAEKRFTFEAFNLGFGHSLDGNASIISSGFTDLDFHLTYTDGTSEAFSTGFEVINNEATSNYSIKLTASGTPKKDVSKITFYIEQPINFNSIGSYSVGVWLGTNNGNLEVSMTTQSEEAGFLEDMYGWMNRIGVRITDGFNNVVNETKNVAEETKKGLAGVLDSILNLPKRLWDVIAEGLKSLFVPTEEYMTEYKDKWDELLSNRLGAVYQVCDIVVSSWDSIMDSDSTDTIEIPSSTIDVGGTPFTFGGYTVQIVPNGFDVLVNALKLIISIVCTYLFINGLLKRYEEIMGGR